MKFICSISVLWRNTYTLNQYMHTVKYAVTYIVINMCQSILYHYAFVGSEYNVPFKH